MYHRRLALIAGVFGVGVFVLASQLSRLTLAHGGELRLEAERKLERTRWLPTVRGRILDRNGLVLAEDRPSYDLAVDYDVITGAWADERAGKYARRVHREEWGRLANEQRVELIDRYLPVYEAHLEQMWDLFAREAGIDRAELDERREGVVERVERMHDSVVRRRRWAEIERTLARGRALTAEVERDIERRSSQPIREQQEAHKLALRLRDTVGFRFEQLSDESVTLTMPDGGTDEVDMLPGLRVIDAGDRAYPYERMTVDVDQSKLPGPIRGEGTMSMTVDGVAAQLLGWMRDGVQAEDIDRRREAIESGDTHVNDAVIELGGREYDQGRYQEGDAVGASGVEQSFEHELRGLRGLLMHRLDTGAKYQIDPEAGQDVRLTIDIRLQARVQAALSPELGLAVVQDWHGEPGETMPLGTPINGAAVVLDVDSGEILAMVSTPTFTSDDLRNDPEYVFEDQVALPYVNRAIAARYTPGSIVKPLIMCAAEKFGNYGIDQRIECTGHFLENRQDVMRCWIYKRFGATHMGDDGVGLTGAQAIKVSCNIFFYTLGQRLGGRGIAEAFRLWGVTEPFGLGIGAEFPGNIGREGEPVTVSDAIFMAIGQGPVDWTPLHAASAYATLARGGIYVPPHIIYDGSPPDPVDLGLSERAVNESLEGLRRSVGEMGGTGYDVNYGEYREVIFRNEGVTVWGKTGTADAPDLIVDPDGDGPIEPYLARTGDHSWFVVLVGTPDFPGGEPRPRYAVAVVMEYSGSGGRVSGPVANQIIEALIAEGYL